jgi:hypothetical protein
MAKQTAGAPIPDVPSGEKQPEPVFIRPGSISPAVSRARESVAASRREVPATQPEMRADTKQPVSRGR